MAEYIEREAALMKLMQDGCSAKNLQSISDIHGADVAPVVRCRECKHSYESVSGLCCTMGPCVDCIVPEGFFCSYGEREGGHAS